MRISATKDEGRVLVVVSDNGVGISSESVDKVFHMFKRLDDRSGDGLGLALVKKQIDRLGGEILVESEMGKGATFTVSFPSGD